MWSRFLKRWSEDFPLVSKLVVLLLLLPINATECEHAVSLMVDVKDSLRTRLISMDPRNLTMR